MVFPLSKIHNTPWPPTSLFRPSFTLSMIVTLEVLVNIFMAVTMDNCLNWSLKVKWLLSCFNLLTIIEANILCVLPTKSEPRYKLKSTRILTQFIYVCCQFIHPAQQFLSCKRKIQNDLFKWLWLFSWTYLCQYYKFLA